MVLRKALRKGRSKLSRLYSHLTASLSKQVFVGHLLCAETQKRDRAKGTGVNDKS